eukprot:TRINITY_DN28858_c0_g1_i1.p2 TRINITY_DN28858_c0_g1~~TRINITY_DN28858_c0_g1_i1.p2  ORF type:complete len:121 (-),score=2.40 TRINITY_DN28858_c0_g1_i1:5-367(-)
MGFGRSAVSHLMVTSSKAHQGKHANEVLVPVTCHMGGPELALEGYMAAAELLDFEGHEHPDMSWAKAPRSSYVKKVITMGALLAAGVLAWIVLGRRAAHAKLMRIEEARPLETEYVILDE